MTETLTPPEWKIRVTTEREYVADVAKLREEFADDIAADGMTDAHDEELLRHLFDQGGTDLFLLVDEDTMDIDFSAPAAASARTKEEA